MYFYFKMLTGHKDKVIIEKSRGEVSLVEQFLAYSHVHISSDEVFSKILKKPSIVKTFQLA